MKVLYPTCPTMSTREQATHISSAQLDTFSCIPLRYGFVTQDEQLDEY